jgi:MerC mercury resistance protein
VPFKIGCKVNGVKITGVFKISTIYYLQRCCILFNFVFYPEMNLKINWDALGVGTSVACAVHCAVLPVLLSNLPVLGINIINNNKFEYFMIFLAFTIGAYTLSHGYRKHHQRPVPLLLFAAGMLLLFAKQYWHHYELWILPFAVLGIVSAHFVNFRFCRNYTYKEPISEQLAK